MSDRQENTVLFQMKFDTNSLILNNQQNSVHCMLVKRTQCVVQSKNDYFVKFCQVF